MSIFVPFNFQPTSTTVRTGSYTIPAGNFAYVKVQCETGGTFSIDGSVALEAPSAVGSKDFDVIAVEQTDSDTSPGGSASASISYTPPSGYYFQGTAFATDTTGGGYSINVEGSIITQSVGEALNITVGENDTITVFSNLSGGGTVTVSLIGASIRNSSPQALNFVQESFWVPAGTQLSETGPTRYTVMLFPEIN